jgi:hypothetical protein
MIRIYRRGQVSQSGFALVAVMAVVTVLLGVGMAFMHWASDESVQSNQSAGAMQAYYLGQMGIVERGFAWLRERQASNLPVGEVVLNGKQVNSTGRYEDVRVNFIASSTGGDFWAQQRRYRISCIGVARVPIGTGGKSDYREIHRKAILYVQVRNFADYMYLTDKEVTNFHDRIKFMSGDTLQGRVHSNDTIAIRDSPVFFELVTSCAPDFWHGPGYNPIFLGPDPVFRVPRVVIPQMAGLLREGASSSGHFYAEAGKTFHASFRGNTVRMWKWPTGAAEDSADSWNVGITAAGTCIFVDGPLDIEGSMTGRCTIGSSGILRIVDNIMYAGCAFPAGDPGGELTDDAPMLGIVSESDIKIANTPANGRENSAGLGRNQPNSHLTDVTITGAVVALGESFTFEQQNDIDSGYVFHGSPDDRGTIYLWGSVTQMRRGYVHRGTLGSTGYLKQYQYDKRFHWNKPPCFFDVTDENGHALFNVVQWGQGVENRAEVLRSNAARYN